MRLRARLIAFAVLLGLAAPVPLVVQTWIQAGRRRATRTEIDDHPELAAPAETSQGTTQDLPDELDPFVEVAAVVLTPPVLARIERSERSSDPFVRSARRRPPARAPPLAA